MESPTPCPHCEGVLQREESCVETIDLRGRGRFTIKDYRFTRCLGCDQEWISYEQSKHNDAEMAKLIRAC